MKNNKNTGSFYTPGPLSGFIVDHLAPLFSDKKELFVLEPSTGDGSFIEAFNNADFRSPKISFTGVEKIALELAKAEVKSKINRKSKATYSFVNEDFLTFESSDNRRYNFIAGNPPYIKKTLLSNLDIERCKRIHSEAGLNKTSIKNIWSAFLIKCSLLLAEDGVLALILPAELLQVSYASELREFLVGFFARTEIFTFDDLLFECKGQDTVLLFAYKKAKVKGQFFANVANVDDLENGNFDLKQNNALVVTGTKWTHHYMSSDELYFIHALKDKLKTVEHYCESKPGIVSAANEFFIIDKKTENQYNLGKHCKPILQKALYVNGSIQFTAADYITLVEQGKPAKILCFSDKDNPQEYSSSVIDYLAKGQKQEFATSYKCKKRLNWHVIPNISTVPQAFFFKRSHFYPKLINNEAKVLVTDSAYKVDARADYQIEAIIYSFYNSLTLAAAELTGRYYGGGVLELTPQEFKKLPLPYISLDGFDFKKYALSFEKKNSITDILKNNDHVILRDTLKLSDSEIERINSIYHKLINKRFRNNTSAIANRSISQKMC